MYTKEIISLLMWPVMIGFTYILSLIALRYFHKKAKQEIEAEK